MDAAALRTAALDAGPKTTPRRRAEQTAEQFEALLVRQLVGSLRQSASIGGSEGLFGGGAGADTYSGWFDEHVAEQIGSSRQLGIKEAILRDIERAGQLAPADAADEAAKKARFAAQAADRAFLATARAQGGGIDVTQ